MNYLDDPINETEFFSLKNYLNAQKYAISTIQEPKLAILNNEQPANKRTSDLKQYVDIENVKYDTRYRFLILQDIYILTYDQLNSLIDDLLSYLMKQISIHADLVLGLVADSNLTEENASHLIDSINESLVSLINKLSIRRLEILEEGT